MSNDKFTPIMYIDDDADDQELFKDAITSLRISYPVINFSNGAEALQYLLSEKVNPFIIFCDINTPKMNGFEFRSRINENEALERTCIPLYFIQPVQIKNM